MKTVTAKGTRTDPDTGQPLWRVICPTCGSAHWYYADAGPVQCQRQGSRPRFTIVAPQRPSPGHKRRHREPPPRQGQPSPRNERRNLKTARKLARRRAS